LFNLDSLKKTRQHVIYAVFAIVLGILIYEGLWLLLPLLACFYSRFPKHYWLFLLVFTLSIAHLHFAQQAPLMPYLDGQQTTYTAEIIHVRRRTEDRQTAVVSIDNTRVFMTFRHAYPRLIPGQRVEITGTLTQPSEPTVPHRFNFRTFLRHQNIQLTVHTSELAILETNFSPWRFQHDLADWVRDRFPIRTASYLQAFFLGVRDDMAEETLSLYSDLGMLHVLAISGVHVTLLTGYLRNALKRIGLMDVLIDGLLVLFCLVFIFATGGSVSIIRACTMAMLAMINRRAKLGLSSFDIFAMVFIVNFVFNPLIVYQRGFQFSYWISFVLICTRPILRNQTPLQARITIVFLARMAAIPISVASGYEINVTSYLSNLILVPLLMQIIFPALLVTLFLPFFAPLTDHMLQLFETLTHFFQPFLNVNVIVGSIELPVVVLLMSALLASCYFYEKHQKLWLRLALIGLYVFVLETNRLWQPDTVITFLDVGQGDSVVIRSPHQSCTVIIDTGGDVSRIHSENPAIFSQTLEPYLLGSGVRNIDFLILTHEHYDHIAEAIPLMQRFNVRHLIISEAEQGVHMQEIVAVAEGLGMAIHVARPLDVFYCGNQVYTFIHDEVHHLDVNEDSLVMTVEANGFNVLLTGDIGHVTEPAILANNHLPYFHIYQVAHHGSRHSNSLAFVEALNIHYAVVQVGRRNLYGHPHEALFDVVDLLGIPLLSNAEHGTVSFRIQQESYQIYVWPFD